ncbi:MAG: DUF423 domain-containing protein [Flavobacteriales bacterium]|jgi:uncharacterized membrane protein YgdD (TMEM256/DUF423 family)
MNYARIAALSLALAVVLGSVGAHGLRPHLTPEQFNSWETAAKYQVYQSLGILALAIAYMAGVVHHSRALWAMRILSIGTLAFCASLYLRSSSPVTGLEFGWLGPVAPVGGLLLIAGWMVAVTAFVHKHKHEA